MIFVTVGTQLPFERFIEAVDLWAKENSREDIFAQIGDTIYVPQYMNYTRYTVASQFDDYVQKSSVIVSHAGMGTIISSLLLEKPIIIMARDADLGEHRNQHQQSTANKFGKLEGCYACYDTQGLLTLLDKRDELKSGTANMKNNDLSKALNAKVLSWFE